MIAIQKFAIIVLYSMAPAAGHWGGRGFPIYLHQILQDFRRGLAGFAGQINEA